MSCQINSCKIQIEKYFKKIPQCDRTCNIEKGALFSKWLSINRTQKSVILREKNVCESVFGVT